MRIILSLHKSKGLNYPSQHKMSMELIFGLGMVLLVLAYLFIKLGEKEQSHMVLQLLLLGFMVGCFIIIGKAGIDSNCNIELVNTSETYVYGGNFSGSIHWDEKHASLHPEFNPADDPIYLFHRETTYNYDEVCEDDNTETIFYNFLLWLSRIIIAYIIIYYIYEVLKYFGALGGSKT